MASLEGKECNLLHILQEGAKSPKTKREESQYVWGVDQFQVMSEAKQSNLTLHTDSLNTHTHTHTMKDRLGILEYTANIFFIWYIVEAQQIFVK